jgi:hypothetical protein
LKATKKVYLIPQLILTAKLPSSGKFSFKFKQFPGPTGLYVENTQDAIKKLKDIQIEDDECKVTFDVTALFPNVPIEDAISLLKKWVK